MPDTPPHVDVAVVGGGVAGLWAVNRLVGAGYDAVLFEGTAVGGVQTLASQGMIHGGTKYTLGGRTTRAFDAIERMPARWRACLAGQGEVDLSGLVPTSEQYYLFAAGGTLGRLTTFFASRSMRGHLERLTGPNHPPALPKTCITYAMNDLVIDPRQLAERLARNVAGRIYQLRVDEENCRRVDDCWRIDEKVTAAELVICAGAGAAELMQCIGHAGPAMQRRPLHQVLVRLPLAEPLFAHCLTGITRAEPRLTLTTHGHGSESVLYIGGQLATDGVGRSTNTQIDAARSELATCLPWVDWSGAEFATLEIDRAEPAQSGGARPDAAFVARDGNVTVCWPTKLTLAPDLGDKLTALLPPPRRGRPAPALALEAPPTGVSPWSR